MDQEIKIKLTVDGKEANAVLQLSNQLFETIVQKASAYTETTTGASISAKNFATDTNAMNQVLAQFGSIISNSDVFLESFKGSMDLIADNLPGLVMGFVNAGKEAESLGISMGTSLVSSLTGPGGLILALQGAMLLLKILPYILDDTAESTKNLTVDAKDLTEKIRTLAAAFNDLPKANENYRKEIYKNNIKEQQALIDVLQAKIAKGGITAKGEFIPWTKEQISEFNNGIKQAEEKIKSYNKEIEIGNKFVSINIELLRSLTKAANEGGPNAVKQFAVQNKLSQEQLNNLTAQLKYYRDSVSSVSGGLAKELEPGIRSTAIQLKLQRNEVIGAIEAIDKYNESFKKKKENDPFEKNKQQELKGIEKYDTKIKAAEELSNMDYLALMEARIKEEDNLKNIESKINDAKNQKEFADLKLQRDLSLERMKLIDDEAKKREEQQNREIDVLREERDKKIKAENENYIKKEQQSREFSEEAAKFEINSLENRFDARNIELGNQYIKENDQLNEWLSQGIISHDEYYKSIIELQRKYGLLQEQNEREKWQAYINEIDQSLNAVQKAFNQFYQNVQSNVKTDVDNWEKGEEDKLEAERKSALAHARTSKERERINGEFDKRKDKLDQDAKKKEYDRLKTWFDFQKALAVAQIAVQMAQAIAKGYGELGPIGGAIAMGVTIAALTAQSIAVATQKMPGYKRGGAVVGEDGPEIIAPFQDYASGQSKLITMTMMTLKDEIRSGKTASYVNSSSGNLDKLEIVISKLNKRLDEGIDARAYLDDRQAKMIYNRGSAKNRRSKI